jgi:hypothetical protein
MTREEGIALYDSHFWETMTHRERAEFQLFEPLLCMPFSVFHSALEQTLGRSVYTHEFAMNVDGLKKELRGEKDPPTMEEIINMIPEDKRVIVIGGRQ